MTPLQQRVLDLLFRDSWFRERFYLTGGTALSAYWIGHRRSIDLDLFTRRSDALAAVSDTVAGIVRQHGLELQPVRSAPTYVEARILDPAEPGAPLKVDFGYEPDEQLEPPAEIGRIVVLSPRDILVNKITATLTRFDEPKDWIDLIAGLDVLDFDIDDLVRQAHRKLRGFDPATFGEVAFRAAEQIDPSRLRLLVPLDRERVRRTLREWGLRYLRPARPPDTD